MHHFKVIPFNGNEKSISAQIQASTKSKYCYVARNKLPTFDVINRREYLLVDVFKQSVKVQIWVNLSITPFE